MVSILDGVEASLKNWLRYLEKRGQQTVTMTLTFDHGRPKFNGFYSRWSRRFYGNLVEVS